MRVLKFGGASVKDAESVRNIPDIISKYRNNELVIIVSAMDKTTNALEALTEAAHAGSSETGERFSGIFNYHQQIIEMLFPDSSHEIYGQIRELFDEIKHWLKVLQDTEREYDFDMYYDQIVSIGELLSTRIVSAYLAEQGYANTWLDARELIMTDHTYRAAKIDWETTYDRIHTVAVPELQKGKMVISQGFIGSTGEFSTTLGREGSDFSAAIFANILDAEEVVVWKDVPGYLNADPKYFKDTVKLDKISYTETIELAFYGAKIIHPKTIRPLKNKSIPLLIKSFLTPDEAGSLIYEGLSSDTMIPSRIIKEDQVLISISSRDFSFIAEDHLYMIFGVFTGHRIGINLMQNSAISFSVCVDESPRLDELIKELQKEFRVKYNDGLRLITIRHYDQDSINKLILGNEILLEQRSRITVQMVVKEAGDE